MREYRNFEKIRELIGYKGIPTNEIITKGRLSEDTIDKIDQKLSEAAHLLCHFPIGYAYCENKISYNRIALSEKFQLMREYPAGSALLDFIALEAADVVEYLKNISDSILDFLKKKTSSAKAGEIVRLDFYEITNVAIDTTIFPLYNDNFFLFLTSCCYLQYITELFIYNFAPTIAVDNYRKMLGNTFSFDENVYDLLTGNPQDVNNIVTFADYGMRMTAAFIDYQLDLLKNDFHRLLQKDEHFPELNTLQYLYLLDSQSCMQGTYTNSNFNTHLMPMEVHRFNHDDIIKKISKENIPVCEVYDIASVQDWFRYEFLYLAKGNILYKQCKNCGRFFIPSGRSDSEYCERLAHATGKTCKEVGATNTFAKKHENDEVHQAYTKAYRRMDSRKRTMYISKQEFIEWSETARQKRDLCKSGQLSFAEFQAWLDESKCR